ncbi:MAG: AEC family transporter [Candidatus Hadarchaeales archaeon]
MSGYLGTAVYVLVPLLAGAALRRVGGLRPLTAPFFRLLEALIMCAILPITVLVSIARYSPSELLGGLGAMWMAILAVGACFLFSAGLCLLAGLKRERTVGVVLNSAFMNVGHLGLPLVYALLGTEYLLPASFYAVAVAVPNLVVGVFMLSSLSGKRKHLLDYLTGFPPLLALLCASAFVALGTPLPEEVGSFFDAYLAGPFFFLMLLFAGYCLEVVKPGKYKEELLVIGSARFLLSPAITILAMMLLDLNFTSDLSPKPSLLLSLMPPAAFNLILAHTYRSEEGLYGAAVMFLTLFSLFLLFPLLFAL